MNFLDYIYYRIWCVLKKTNAKDVAEYVTCIFLVILLGLNIIVILGNTGFNPLEYISSYTFGLMLFIPLMLIMYMLFLRKNRHLHIIDKFSKESKKEQFQGYIILGAYFLFTLTSLIFF